MDYIHKNLASGRWFELSPIEQLANIGSEVERSITWYRKDDKEQFQKAFARMLELIDLTIDDPRWRGPKLKELTRLREEICEQLYGPGPDSRILDSLRKDFLYYGILARQGRR